MKEVTLTVILTLNGPVIAGSSAAGAFGIDLPFARTGSDQFYLPGTHVKGRLRESLEAIQTVLEVSDEEIEEWLGKGSSDYRQPKRGRLIFEDFVTSGEDQRDIRTRIRMDPERGAVRKGAYLVIEAPFRSGEAVEFTGHIRFFCENDDEFSKIKDILHKGLRWIPALGGQRSTGFGRLTDVKFEKKSETLIPESVTLRPSCEALELKLFPKSPFCIGRPGKTENLFESDIVISGGVIKGSIANTLNRILGKPMNEEINDSLPSPWTELGRYFPDIRFDHAFPSPGGGTRPVHYPLSTVRTPGDEETDEAETHDVIFWAGPRLIHGKAPVFSTDWKGEDYEAVEPLFGWGKRPDTVLRVRTAMDKDKRRADEGKLFAYEMISPEHFVWHGRANLTKVPENERAKVRSQLETLLAEFGIRYLGKTKADVKVTVSPAGKQTVPNPVKENFWVVTLQTPGLMIEPKSSLNGALVVPEILFDEYLNF